MPVGTNVFVLCSETSQHALGPTQTLFQWVQGLFPGVKRPRREVNHSPPSSAKVKDTWSYTPTLPYVPSRSGKGKFGTGHFRRTRDANGMNDSQSTSQVDARMSRRYSHP